MFKALINKLKDPLNIKLKIILFFSLALFARLFFYLKLHVVLFCGDSSSYLSNTYNLLEGSELIFDTRPPGSSFFMFFVWKIFGQDYFNIVIAHLVVSVLAWTVLFYMFSRYFSRTGLIFFFLLLLNSLPVFWFEDYIIYSESLSLSLCIFSMAFFGLALYSKKRLHVFLCSLFVTFSILTKSSLLPLLCFLVILFIFNYNNFKIWNNFGLTFLPFVLLMTIYSFHNYNTLNTFSLFKFGDFARMMSVNFIINDSFSDDKDIKKALTYYSEKIDPSDRQTITNINSIFETSPGIRKIYSNNCDNIYYYYNYLSDSLKKTPMQIFSSTKDFVSIGRKKDSRLYFNFIVNNFISFLTNTKQGVKYPVNTINQTHLVKNLSADLIGKEYIQKKEFSRYFTSVGFYERNLPSFLLKVMFIVNQVFRNMFWLIIFVISFILNLILIKRSKLKDPFSIFNFTLSGFALAYILLIVTTGSANVDRYALFSDVVLYMSFIFLCYAVNKIFYNHISRFKNSIGIKN